MVHYIRQVTWPNVASFEEDLISFRQTRPGKLDEERNLTSACAPRVEVLLAVPHPSPASPVYLRYAGTTGSTTPEQRARADARVNATFWTAFVKHIKRPVETYSLLGELTCGVHEDATWCRETESEDRGALSKEIC